MILIPRGVERVVGQDGDGTWRFLWCGGEGGVSGVQEECYGCIALDVLYEVVDFGMLCLLQVHFLMQRSACRFLIRSLLHLTDGWRPLRCVVMGQFLSVLSGLSCSTSNSI
jgi:hypothetical protein